MATRQQYRNLLSRKKLVGLVFVAIPYQGVAVSDLGFAGIWRFEDNNLEPAPAAEIQRVVSLHVGFRLESYLFDGTDLAESLEGIYLVRTTYTGGKDRKPDRAREPDTGGNIVAVSGDVAFPGRV